MLRGPSGAGQRSFRTGLLQGVHSLFCKQESWREACVVLGTFPLLEGPPALHKGLEF